MDYLDKLEEQSIYIFREAYREFKNLAMLWSIGKDSTVMLWLAKKAFFGHVPFPLVHIDTSFKIPEMIEFRNKLALEWKLNLIVGQNKKVLQRRLTFPDEKV
jgi:sulfate adenylyltransferase subunit 2